MDWMALISMLLTTILPLIINKGVNNNKVALQRRAVAYARFAENAPDGLSAAALFEVSEACNCMAVAKTDAEQQQIFAATQDAFAGVQRAMAAKAAA